MPLAVYIFEDESFPKAYAVMAESEEAARESILRQSLEAGNEGPVPALAGSTGHEETCGADRWSDSL